jgi:hypothetical protein
MRTRCSKIDRLARFTPRKAVVRVSGLSFRESTIAEMKEEAREEFWTMGQVSRSIGFDCMWERSTRAWIAQAEEMKVIVDVELMCDVD